MKSYTNRRFRRAFERLPWHVQRQARVAYALFIENPFHPSLRFRQVHPTKPIYSARIGRDYRAVGVREGDEVVWFWIGPHAEYDQLISGL
ncbi:MAG: hypothetical protein L0177_08075 [Chloroflexi bacterium]|nr:hypothetical protein [Chloroflexota bacterium]